MSPLPPRNDELKLLEGLELLERLEGLELLERLEKLELLEGLELLELLEGVEGWHFAMGWGRGVAMGSGGANYLEYFGFNCKKDE